MGRGQAGGEGGGGVELGRGSGVELGRGQAGGEGRGGVELGRDAALSWAGERGRGWCRVRGLRVEGVGCVRGVDCVWGGVDSRGGVGGASLRGICYCGDGACGCCRPWLVYVEGVMCMWVGVRVWFLSVEWSGGVAWVCGARNVAVYISFFGGVDQQSRLASWLAGSVRESIASPRL